MTGVTGFIGQNLHRHLEGLGWAVDFVTRHDSVHDMNRKIQALKPDVAIHLATHYLAEHKSSDISDLIQSNISFGTTVAEALVQNGVCKFVNAGTSWQYYDGQRDIPANLYAATKSAFEDILRFYASAHSLQVITLMLSDTYGACDPRPKILPKLLSLAGSQERLALSSGEQRIEWTYISDVVKAFEIAALRLVTRIETQPFVKYAVGSNEIYSLKEVVAICEQITGQKILADFGMRPDRQREVRAPVKLDPTLPNWRAQVNFEEGIRKCLNDGPI